jgi:predicted nucleotidyltransferase
MLEHHDILRALNDKKVDYIVVGGVAINLYGHGRLTTDLDLLLALHQDNLNLMDEVMKELQFQPRQPIHISDLENEEKVRELVVTKNFLAYTFFTPLHPFLHVDVLAEKLLRFQEFKKRIEVMQVDDIKIPVVNIDDLLDMKREANRPKDQGDIDALENLKKL